jgi:acyl-CoA dehydrogenase
MPNYHAEHEMFTDSVRKYIFKEIAPHLRKWEKDDFFPNSVFKGLGDQGYLGVFIPEEYGGIGGDYKLAAAWCEVFGELCDVGLTTAVNMHSLVISAAVAKYGSKACKDKWLKDAVAGIKIGAYAFTEPGAGSDLASLRTTAVKNGNKWIINGSKIFITNGARADFILVLTKTDPKAGYKGFTTFIVDTKTKGFQVAKKLDKVGWRSSDTAELVFDNVEIEEEFVLGQVGEGWKQASLNLNWERLMLTLTSLAGARIVLKEAVLYAKNRVAFGKKIFEIDAVNEILLSMLAKIKRGEAITYHALDLLQDGKPCRAEVSFAKRLVCEDAIWIADKALQIHGGYGYTKEFSPEKWWRDLRLMTLGGGTSEIMSEIIAKEIFAA